MPTALSSSSEANHYQNALRSLSASHFCSPDYRLRAYEVIPERRLFDGIAAEQKQACRRIYELLDPEILAPKLEFPLAEVAFSSLEIASQFEAAELLAQLRSFFIKLQMREAAKVLHDQLCHDEKFFFFPESPEEWIQDIKSRIFHLKENRLELLIQLARIEVQFHRTIEGCAKLEQIERGIKQTRDGCLGIDIMEIIKTLSPQEREWFDARSFVLAEGIGPGGP